jgi:hypothetical protein
MSEVDPSHSDDSRRVVAATDSGPVVRAQSSESAQPLPKGPPAHDTKPAVPPVPFAGEPAVAESAPEPASGIGRRSEPETEWAEDDTVALPSRLDFRAEALYWWVSHGQTPPLVTTGPVSSAGILGMPGTAVLFGGDLDNEEQWGGRFRLGYGLDPDRTWRLEAGFFFLGQRAVPFAASSNGAPLLARPFFDLNAGTEFSQVTVGPGTAGGITVSSPTRLWGADGNVRYNLASDATYRVDLLGGVRYLSLQEGLNIVEQIQAGPEVPGFAFDRITVFDSFATRNDFYGGQVGVSAEFRRGAWSLDVRGQVAVGSNHETVAVQGGQAITMPGGTMSFFNGGLLALATNSGRSSRDQFATVPEVGLNVGYRLTENVRALVGYDVLYWSNAVRPGDQIDRVLDVTRIPNFNVGATPTGQARPALPFRQSDFWVQGITFGLEFRY